MIHFAPLTKLILTVIVSVWSLLLPHVNGLLLLLAVELAVIFSAGIWRKTGAAVRALTVIALVLVLLQYGLGSAWEESLASGLRMVAMTTGFIILLAVTRPQELSTALVQQCRAPAEYAFMFTSALRFIPDFLAESKAVQEAQACRGYSAGGNIFKSMLAFLAIVKPLVLKAIKRSETMAMSMELRGFGGKNGRSFTVNVAWACSDYLLLTAVMAVTVGLFVSRWYGWF